MPKGVRCELVGGAALQHHGSVGHSNALHAPFHRTQLVVAVAGTVFVLYTLVFEVGLEFLVDVYRFTVSPHESKLQRPITLLEMLFKVDKFCKRVRLHFQNINVAFPGVVVQVQLKAVILVFCETHVHVQSVIGARRADVGVL